MSTACKSIKEKQLPAHSVSTEIFSGIAWFPCDSTALLVLLFVFMCYHLGGVYYRGRIVRVFAACGGRFFLQNSRCRHTIQREIGKVPRETVSRIGRRIVRFNYRAMHFSAKRGIAIACRLSVNLSVCDVGEL